MNRGFWLGVVFMAGIGAGEARAEWVNISGTLPETDIQTLAAHPTQPDRLYAVAGKNLYFSRDAGAQWKRVLSVRGGNELHFIYPDPKNVSIVYVATSHGARKSADAGKSWKTVYQGVGNEAKIVHWIGALPQEGWLWLGTGKGLVRLSEDGKNVSKVATFPDVSVYSMQASPEGGWFAATSQGIYKSVDQGEHS